MATIYQRELKSFFYTPVGYVYIGVFTALGGVLFYLGNLQQLSGDLLSFLSQLSQLNLLLTPLLTMRLLCEERQKGTDQLLLTSPLPLSAIVLGKFLAAATVVMGAVLLSNLYTLIIALYGTVYGGEWFVGYLGLTLQSLAFLAVDLLVSCFAKSPTTAALSAFAANFILWMLDLLARYAPAAWMGKALSFISLYERYQPFLLGQLSFASLAFFLFLIGLCLVCTIHLLDARRFAEGGAS